jgi:SAM-dependent methyltransferase
MPITDTATYWDRYAGKRAPDTDRETRLKRAFDWTQYEGHGPGDELLGQPLSALELGCGHGDAVAALAEKGIDATGIDLSPTHIEAAHETWATTPGAHYHQADALDFLATTTREWDAIYSIWGGMWFTDPARLLPLVFARLVPGGVVAFSHAPAVPGSYGPQGMYGAGFTGRQVWIYQWAYEPSDWADLLRRYGFRDVVARVLDAPEPGHVGTLIVTARV